MSGHSKFANIKHKKEKNDAKKGKIFTIIGREIVIAVKETVVCVTVKSCERNLLRYPTQGQFLVVGVHLAQLIIHGAYCV